MIPVQAKGGNDRLSRVQIEQDIALCTDKLPDLICRPIGAQIMREDVIALLGVRGGRKRYKNRLGEAVSIGGAGGHNSRGPD